MTDYIVVEGIFGTENVYKVNAKTKEEACFKLMWKEYKKDTIEHIYHETIMKYFINDSYEYHPDQPEYNNEKTAIEMFLKDAKENEILAKYQDIILNLIQDRDNIEHWMESDPFPLELKIYLCNAGNYHDYIAYTEDEMIYIK